MSGIVPTRSFVFTSGGVDRFYRQDVTAVDTTTDLAWAADQRFFIASGGAKLANTSFVFTSGGVDRHYRKGKTRVAVTDPAFVAVPAYFT